MSSNENDKQTLLALLIMIVPVILLIAVLVYADKIDGWDGTRVRGYPCDVAEISPDIPLEVKEKCRKLRSGL